MEKVKLTKDYIESNRDEILEAYGKQQKKNAKKPVLTKKQKKLLGIGKDQGKAVAKYVRVTPRKVKIVLDLIRNKPADEAMAILKFTPKAACEPLAKLLKSAMANAENNFDMDVERLYVAECTVSQGPTLKRIRPRAHGRAFRINKKTSHINLVLKEME